MKIKYIKSASIKVDRHCKLFIEKTKTETKNNTNVEKPMTLNF